jgi:hypothetical protein
MNSVFGDLIHDRDPPALTLGLCTFARSHEERFPAKRDPVAKSPDGEETVARSHKSWTIIFAFAMALATPTMATAGGTHPAVISGVLVGTVLRDGSPVSGAEVRLVAWPTSQILASLPAGKAVPTLLVAETTSNAAGRFSIKPKVVPADYRDSSGTTNYEISANDGDVSATWNMPLNAAQRNVGLTFDLGIYSGVGVDSDPSQSGKASRLAASLRQV